MPSPEDLQCPFIRAVPRERGGHQDPGPQMWLGTESGKWSKKREEMVNWRDDDKVQISEFSDWMLEDGQETSRMTLTFFLGLLSKCWCHQRRSPPYQVISLGFPSFSLCPVENCWEMATDTTKAGDTAQDGCLDQTQKRLKIELGEHQQLRLGWRKTAMKRVKKGRTEVWGHQAETGQLKFWWLWAVKWCQARKREEEMGMLLHAWFSGQPTSNWIILNVQILYPLPSTLHILWRLLGWDSQSLEGGEGKRGTADWLIQGSAPKLAKTQKSFLVAQTAQSRPPLVPFV